MEKKITFQKMVSKMGNLSGAIKGYGKTILLDNITQLNEAECVNIQISLLTDDMIALDNQFLVSEWSASSEDLKMYRPYFFEFYASISFDQWKIIEKNVGSWKEIVLSDPLESEGNNGAIIEDEIEGVVIFSASPLKRRQKYLKFDSWAGQIPEIAIKTLKNTLKKLIAKESKKKSVSVCEEVMRAINDFHGLDVTVYNVGQGNFIELLFTNTKEEEKKKFEIDYRVLFDIGMTPFGNPKENRFIRENVKYFKDSTPSAIILSHWDTDHILGITDLNQKWVFSEKVLWIVPDPTEIDKSVTQNAYRLLAVLLQSNANVQVIKARGKKRNQPVCKTDDGSVRLWKGFGNKIAGTKARFSAANNLGLILQIEKNGKAFLFPGDCEYTQMPSSCIRHYTFMVASHHGAKQEIPKALTASGFGRCIVSCGSNPYGHPTREYLMGVRKRGYVFIGVTDYAQKFQFRLLGSKALVAILNYRKAVNELCATEVTSCSRCLEEYGVDMWDIYMANIF